MWEYILGIVAVICFTIICCTALRTSSNYSRNKNSFKRSETPLPMWKYETKTYPIEKKE